MMAFRLSEFTDLLDKGPCFAKVAEPEGPLDTMSVVADLSARTIPTQNIYRSVPWSFLSNLSGQLFDPTC